MSNKKVGISWLEDRKVWVSGIRVKSNESKRCYLGSYKDENEASEMYQLAKTNIDLFENPSQFRELLKQKRQHHN